MAGTSPTTNAAHGSRWLCRHLVEGATTNIKITTKTDLHLAEAILKAMPKPKVDGPIHPFAEEEMWGGKGLKG